MNFRKYIILMTLSTIGAWISWLVVIHGIDPTQSGFLGFLLFYLTLSIAMIGALSLSGIGIRQWMKLEIPLFRITLRAFRQAVLLTALFVGSLVLVSQGWFVWWAMCLLIIIVTFIELAALSRNRSS